jgi:nitrogen regulatory protein PII
MPEANGVNAVLADVLAEIKTFEYTSSEGDVVVFVEDVENILSKYFR